MRRNGLRPEVEIGKAHLEDATVRHCMSSIGAQIHQDLMNLGRIGHGKGFGLYIRFHFNT